MSTKISLEYFGMPGHGATVKDAKADAGRKIERLVEDAGNGLRIVTCGSSHAVVWRAMQGWNYALIACEWKLVKNCYEFGVSSFPTMDTAMVAAALHICDVEWKAEVKDDREFFATSLEIMLPVRLVRDADLRELVERAAWRRPGASGRRQGIGAEVDMTITNEKPARQRDYGPLKPCMTCGTMTPLGLLDAKPKRLSGPIVNADEWFTELTNALWANEDCDYLDCERCYGPGWDEP